MSRRDDLIMKNRGFALTELLAVLAILGILLGIATISGRDWLQRYRVEGQTKEMYADLMNARVSAMQRNRMFFVTLAENQYAIYEDTYNASTPTSPEGDGVPQTANDRLVMQKTFQYSLNAGFPAGFIFNSNGLFSPELGETTLSFTSTANPLSDCIVLSTTRILMGKMNGTCVTQ
jgi:prepilin-type N-terminal cleavage/methylation domain-containing protein